MRKMFILLTAFTFFNKFYNMLFHFFEITVPLNSYNYINNSFMFIFNGVMVLSNAVLYFFVISLIPLMYYFQRWSGSVCAGHWIQRYSYRLSFFLYLCKGVKEGRKERRRKKQEQEKKSNFSNRTILAYPKYIEVLEKMHPTGAF